MDEQLFQTTIPTFIDFKFYIYKFLAIGACIFSIYNFNENPFFFSLALVAGISVFLFAGPWRITLHKEFIIVSRKGLVHNSPLQRKYDYQILKEVVADMPDQMTSLLNERIDPISASMRFVVIPEKTMPKSFWITTTSEDLKKAVDLTNQMIGDKNNSIR